ncbi:MAG: protein kinase domain-containing protein [Solirubrobacterales bacterium]
MIGTVEVREGSVLADRYEVVERLGSGGMATVFLAEDQTLGRLVAVKRMRVDGGETDLRRFRREARLGATLSHPNVVTVFDTLAGEDGFLIVMEYVNGETLADALDRGPLPPKRALEVLAGVAAALDHAHANDVVHRDVKPANVLLGEDGSVKLADLGIATAAEATRITTAHDIVGTLAYVPPERLDLSSPGGPEADVYGFAALAYETLGGERVNRGSTPAEVVHQATVAPPPDLRDAWPQAPAEAVRVLREGMSRDPGKRPQSAGDLFEALERALTAAPRVADQTEPIAGPVAPPPLSPGERVLGERSDHAQGPRLGLWAIGAAAALAAVVLAVVLFATGDTDDPGAGHDASTPARPASGGPQNAGADATRPSPGAAAAETEEPVPEEGSTGDEDPAALNDEGFALLQEGRAEEAIVPLQRAVDSFPEGTTDLTYAFALFNLGSALRAAGRPEEAIPVLEQRLEIPNQTETVQRELDLARADAGSLAADE